MKITKVCCQGCGADLDIDEKVRFVTCNYCHARLEVVHDATITHTKQLDQIERRTNDMAKQLKVMELRSDIEHLDREWEKFRKSALTRDERGELLEPDEGIAVLGGILTFGAGIIWIIVSIAGGFWPVALIGLVIFGIAILWMKNGSEKARSFKIQKHRYETARKSIQLRIDAKREN